MRKIAIEFNFSLDPLTIFCVSDLHIDSPDFDKEKFLLDMEKAKKSNAVIFIGGDIWSAIFPSDRKRYSGARQIAQVDTLIDYAVNVAFETLKPYADNIYLLTTGNHEASVIKYHYTDPTNILRQKLQEVRSKKLPHIRHGGFCGFLLLKFSPEDKKAKHTTSEIWFYHHGKGTNAPVTKGAIDLYRIRVGNIAHVYWLQHKHTSINDIPVVRYVDSRGNVRRREILSFFTAGYEGGINYNRDYEKEGYQTDYNSENFYEQSSTGGVTINYRFVDKDGIINIRKTIKHEVNNGL